MDNFRIGSNTDERFDDIYTSFDKKGYSNNGLIRARVEYNRDPRKLGRVKIRILDMHGVPSREVDSSDDRDNNYSYSTSDSSNEGEYDNSYTPHQHLPWAYPCFPQACGPDFGSYMVPPVGTVVWVLPEANSENFVYLGGMFSVNVQKERELGRNTDFGESQGNVEKPNFEENKDRHGMDTRGFAKLQAPAEDDTPIEIKNSFDLSKRKSGPPKDEHEVEREEDDYEFEPTLYLVFKSPKGHLLAAEECIEDEHIRIEDRAGQSFKFYAPVRRDTQISDDPKTGLPIDEIQKRNNTSDKDNPLDYYKKLGRTQDGKRIAYISLQDVHGQNIRFWAEHKKQEINLVSQDLTKDEEAEEGRGYKNSQIDNSVQKWKQEDSQNKEKEQKLKKFSRVHLVSGKRRDDCGAYIHSAEQNEDSNGYIRETYMYVSPGNSKEEVMDEKKPGFSLIDSITGAELSSFEKQNQSGETAFLAIKEDLKERKIVITAKKQGGQSQDGTLGLGIEISLKDKKMKFVTDITNTEKSSLIEMSENGLLISTGQEVKVIAKKDVSIKTEMNTIITAKKDCVVNTEGNTTVTAKKDCTISTEGKTDVAAKGNCSVKTEATCDVVANNGVNVSAQGSCNVSAQGNTTVASGSVIYLSAPQVVIG